MNAQLPKTAKVKVTSSFYNRTLTRIIPTYFDSHISIAWHKQNPYKEVELRMKFQSSAQNFKIVIFHSHWKVMNKPNFLSLTLAKKFLTANQIFLSQFSQFNHLWAKVNSNLSKPSSKSTILTPKITVISLKIHKFLTMTWGPSIAPSASSPGLFFVSKAKRL